jgi:putative hemolysin
MRPSKFALPLVACTLMTMVLVASSTRNPVSLSFGRGTYDQVGRTPQAHRISNPAAVYCTELGYAYQVVNAAGGGQSDTCTMPDGVVCSAWDFLQGKCGQTYSYCARQGLGLRIATDGKNVFSHDYAVCVDEHGRDAGSVTTLDNLSARLNRCAASAEQVNKNSLPSAATLPSQAASRPLANLAGTPPSSWDWRDATSNGITGDWTTPVKNQGNCGSCWAFAAVGQAEAVLNLAADNPALDKDLSEEYLVSACFSDGSCCGGWHFDALDSIEDDGIPDENCLAYASGSCGCSSTGTCSPGCQVKIEGGCTNTTCSARCSDYDSRLSYIDAFGRVGEEHSKPATQQALIKLALVAYGPLSVAMDVAEGDNYWDESVLMCSNPPDVDHAVVIVGYNDAGGYWIVKNSWGSSYGEAGYFKVGYGQCLIEKYVYYAFALPGDESNPRIFLPLVIQE